MRHRLALMRNRGTTEVVVFRFAGGILEGDDDDDGAVDIAFYKTTGKVGAGYSSFLRRVRSCIDALLC